MTIFELDEELRSSFLAAYDMEEHAVLALRDAELRLMAAEQPVPEAFEDGIRLRRAMVAVYSADRQSEYETDKANYDRIATEINDTYGDIVVPTAESVQGVLGLRGHRISPVSSVTTRNAHGTTHVWNVADEVEKDDERIRQGADRGPTSRSDPRGEHPSRRCSRCGAPPSWVVTARYDMAEISGRLMVYCDACRSEMSARLGTVLPLDLVDLDPSAVLTMLYASGATKTDPDVVAEMVGVAPGAWTTAAREAIQAGD